jgi:hypothetical protein
MSALSGHLVAWKLQLLAKKLTRRIKVTARNRISLYLKEIPANSV